MKRDSFSNTLFSLWDQTRRFHLPVWIVFHVLLLCLFVLTTPIRVDSDLFSILPDSNASLAVSHADRKLSTALNGTFSVLVGHKDFLTAKMVATELVAGCSGRTPRRLYRYL